MTNRSRPAAARSLGDGRIGIWCHYDDRFEAKALPSARWDNNLKCWTVAQSFRADADRLVERLNRRYSGDAAGHTELADAIAAMFEALPTDMRRSTHRALSRALHPDTGGTEACMKALNGAWDTIGGDR